jgi:hypothetical protein
MNDSNMLVLIVIYFIGTFTNGVAVGLLIMDHLFRRRQRPDGTEEDREGDAP